MGRVLQRIVRKRGRVLPSPFVAAFDQVFAHLSCATGFIQPLGLLMLEYGVVVVK